MNSSAFLLIQKHHKSFLENPCWGIEAEEDDSENYFVWYAKIRGLKGTIWEDATFVLRLQFDENYNKVPPNITFVTVPYHPNIDTISGLPCIHFFQNKEWDYKLSFYDLLLSIQSLLSEPDLKYPVNFQATNLYISAPSSYDEIVKTNFENFKHISRKKERNNKSLIIKDTTEEHSRSHRPSKQAVQLSFENYLETWSKIGTSLSPQNDVLSEDNGAHVGNVSYSELHDYMSECDDLTYGKFKKFKCKNSGHMKDEKLKQIDRMKLLYMNKQNQSFQNYALDNSEDDDVDDLVSWADELEKNKIL